jgi:hypothetical protein
MERCSKKRIVLALEFMLIGASGPEGQDVALQQLSNDHRKGGETEATCRSLFSAEFKVAS